jgi:putative ABC transport system permease protein
MALTYVLLLAARPFLAGRYGIFLEITGLAADEWLLLGAVVASGLLAGFIPAARAYRNSLADGLTIRV